MPIVTDSEGSSTVITGSGRGSSTSASVSPIVTSAMPGDGDDLARPGLLGVDAVERLGDVQLGDLRPLDRRRRRGTRRSAGRVRIVPWRTRQSASRPT